MSESQCDDSKSPFRIQEFAVVPAPFIRIRLVGCDVLLHREAVLLQARDYCEDSWYLPFCCVCGVRAVRGGLVHPKQRLPGGGLGEPKA